MATNLTTCSRFSRRRGGGVNVCFLWICVLPVLCITAFGGARRMAWAAGSARRDLPQPAVDGGGGNQQPAVCPCVRPSGGGSGCVAYNPHYQAATLEEAVANFVDLSSPDPSQATNLIYQHPISTDNNNNNQPVQQCSSLECMACVHSLTERLIQLLGPLQSARWGITHANEPQYSGTTAMPLSQYCRRLQQQQQQRPPPASNNGQTTTNTPGPARNDLPAVRGNNGSSGQNQNQNQQKQQQQSKSQFPDDQAWLIIGDLAMRPFMNESTTTASPTTPSSMINVTASVLIASSTTHSSKRDKRAASKSSGTRIGVTTPLDCSYKKGAPLGDNSGYVGLCTLCWSLRTLSPKYFPRYINELSCSSGDTGCLSGYGKCRERYRSVDVLYNAGTDSSPKWRQYSINSPIACECQLSSGSALHNFISH